MLYKIKSYSLSFLQVVLTMDLLWEISLPSFGQLDLEWTEVSVLRVQQGTGQGTAWYPSLRREGLKDNGKRDDAFGQMDRVQWKSMCKNVLAFQNVCRVVNVLPSLSESSSMFISRQKTKCFCFNPEIHDSPILCLKAKMRSEPHPYSFVCEIAQ